MSNLTVNISSERSVVIQPEETVTVVGDIVINRIVDIPGEQKVIAFVDGIGGLNLDELSGDNYDSPAEWTNADVVTAIQNLING